MALPAYLDETAAAAGIADPEAAIGALLGRFDEPGHLLRGRLATAGPTVQSKIAAAKRLRAELAAAQGDIADLLLALEALGPRAV